jgi:uncharacterized membrane protein YkvA (DUF1232 family)
VVEQLKHWAREMKLEALTVWYISKNPETPWYVRLFALLLVAYAFSPIDLIPDFIPVIGYLDDLVIVPAGVYLLLRITPEIVISDSRVRARAHVAARSSKPTSKLGIFLAVVVWSFAVLVVIALLMYVLSALQRARL